MARPSTIWVLYHGRPAMLKDVTMIDPRFEFMDVPMPQFNKEDPRQKLTQGSKFLGQFTFSLPVVDPGGKRVIRWIVVPREPFQFIGNKAFIDSKADGVKAPLDWADHADIMDDSGGRVAVNYGNIAQAG